MYLKGVFKKRPNCCYKDFILQYFKSCPLQSSPLYWRYTVPNISSIVGVLPGTHFLWWRAVLLSHIPEYPLVQKKTELFVGLIRRTPCERAQFSGCSSTTNAHSEMGQMAVCCQNLPLGALSSRSAPSVLVSALFKKISLFLAQVYICGNFHTKLHIAISSGSLIVTIKRKAIKSLSEPPFCTWSSITILL